MKKHLERILIESHTPEWYEFRKSGVGSSEIGTILGLNPYQLALSLYLEKIGYRKPFVGNIATYFGTVMEQVVADAWQRYDPTIEDSLVKHLNAGTTARTCHKIKGYIKNPEYPWMFSSPDRIANKNQFTITGQVLEDEFIVECKTAIGFVLKKWLEGVPPTYVAQVQQQMLVCELDYAEIAILGDGRNLEVFPIEPSEQMFSTILEETEMFWDLVLQGQVLMEEYNASKSEHEKELIMDKIYDIAPRPVEGQEELYKEFLNERYLEEPTPIAGTNEMLDACSKIKNLDALYKKIGEMMEGEKNKVREYMAEHERMEFDSVEGRVSWKSNAKGVRVFKNGVKTPIDVGNILIAIEENLNQSQYAD